MPLKGDWEAAEKRAAAGPDEAAGTDDDVFGDFEDMEAGMLSSALPSPAHKGSLCQYKGRADSCPSCHQYLSAAVMACPSQCWVRVPAALPGVQTQNAWHWYTHSTESLGLRKIANAAALSSGQGFGKDGDAATATAMKALRDEAKALRNEKAAKKAAFDSEYDIGERSSCPSACTTSLFMLM